MTEDTKTKTGSTKDIAAPATLADVMLQLNDNQDGLDRVRNVLALRMNQYNDIQLTPTDVKGLARAFKDISAGSATNLILMCSKDTCVYKNRCILYEQDKCPEGKECFHENFMLNFYMDEYLKSLDVSTENMPEMVMINMLVEYEILEYRCNSILSHSHTDMKWTRVVGLDKQGEIVESEEISYALNIKDMVQKKKLALLQEFTATRRERWKKSAALKETKEGPSKIISSLKAKIKDKMKDNVDPDDVKDALLNNPLDDEYIIDEV
jgi:hypothetical protein